MEAFYQQLAYYQSHPELGMADKLTEIIAGLELKEDDQNAAFEALDALLTTCDKESLTLAQDGEEGSNVLDEGSKRLVQLLQHSTKNTSVFYPVIRAWLEALAEGRKKHQIEAEAILLDVLPEVTFPRIKELCERGLVRFRRVECTEATFHTLSEAFTSTFKEAMSLDQVFECAVRPEDQTVPFEKEKNTTRLLCHCSRYPGALGKILNEGLQVKGAGGRLGAAIYLSDTIEKCLMYSGTSKLDAGMFGMVLVVETVLGRIYETSREVKTLPIGYDSVHALGSYRAKEEKQVTCMDGTTSRIGVGKTRRDGIQSSFQHSEFAIYDPARVRIRYVLIYRDTSLNRVTAAAWLASSTSAPAAPAKRQRVAEEEEEDPAILHFRLLQQIQSWNRVVRLMMERYNRICTLEGVDSDAAKEVKRTLDTLQTEEYKTVLQKVYATTI
jgi:hypothetical protein